MAMALLAGACTIERGDVRTPSGEPPEADTARVRQAVEAIARAFEAGDLAALDTLYHERVTVFEGGGVDRGWSEYRDGHLAPEIAALQDRRFTLEEIQVRRAGSTAWVTFRFTLSAVHDAEPVSARGLGTMVFRKLGGRWRVVHSHTSTGG